MKPKFRQVHFVGVESSNQFAFGLALEKELLIAINSGPGEFVINYSIFIDDRFIKDSKYLLELLMECIHHWLFDKDYKKQCFSGPVWVNPDLKQFKLLQNR